jgi:transcriptional regulator with XRE-family HTH domain
VPGSSNTCTSASKTRPHGCVPQSWVVYCFRRARRTGRTNGQGFRVLHLHLASPSKNASPTPIDAQVGARIRLRRVMLGLPMTQVAKKLGISWQQLGKYEQAKDSVSASMLYLIALALGVTVDSFFAGLQQEEANGRTVKCSQTATIADLISRDSRGRHIGRLIASYWRITDAEQRDRVLDLVQSLADWAGAPKPDTKSRRANTAGSATLHIHRTGGSFNAAAE